MKEKAKHIVSLFMMFNFLAFYVGIEINHHICEVHSKHTVSVFEKPDCPCKHEKEETCNNCGTNHNDCDSEQSQANPLASQFTDSCCEQFTFSFELNDDFQFNTISNSISYYPIALFEEPISKYSELKESIILTNSHNPRDKIDIISPIINFIYFSSLSIEEDFLSIS